MDCFEDLHYSNYQKSLIPCLQAPNIHNLDEEDRDGNGKIWTGEGEAVGSDLIKQSLSKVIESGDGGGFSGQNQIKARIDRRILKKIKQASNKRNPMQEQKGVQTQKQKVGVKINQVSIEQKIKEEENWDL